MPGMKPIQNSQLHIYVKCLSSHTMLEIRSTVTLRITVPEDVTQGSLPFNDVMEKPTVNIRSVIQKL